MKSAIDFVQLQKRKRFLIRLFSNVIFQSYGMKDYRLQIR